MTSANDWFKKIKSRAQSVQETAKTRIEKLTETLDKKLKEAQEDLDKQRLKAEASEPGFSQQQIWRPSIENPDGEILTIPKPPPIDPSTPLESPPISAPPIEPPTIAHRKGRRRLSKKNESVSASSLPIDPESDSGNEQKSSSIRSRNNRKEITLCLNDIITEIVDRENIEKCLNELIDIISTVDELVDNITFIDIPLKEDLTSHVEQNIDIDTKESISSETETDEEDSQKNIPKDELTLVTNSNHGLIEHFGPENIQNNKQEDELPPLTYIDDAPIEYTDSKDELSTTLNTDDARIEQPDSKPIQINAQEDELPTMTNIDDTSDEHIDRDDDILTLNNTDDTRNIQPDPLRNIEDIPIEHTDPENIQMNLTDDELPTSTNTDDMLIEHSDSKDKLLTLTNAIQPTIEHFDPNENHLTITDNSIKTPQNELEDSFDEFRVPNIPEHRPSQIPIQKSTDLAELRNFISKLEDAADADEESLSTTENIKPLDEVVNNPSKPLDPPNIIEDIFPSSSSSSTSISEVTQEDTISSFSTQLDSLSNELPTNDINDAKLVEKKRFSIVNCHSIPSGTKISHMNCSSTYIYICTNDRKIFYAKLNLNDINLPFKWQQHSDLAERLVVSVSNRTVWRLFNKRLYSSNDPIKFPPIGSQWNEIKIDNKSSLLSMSINDQCGWYIKGDGTLWLIRTDDEVHQPLDVACPFNLNTVFCFSEKVGVTTLDGEILIRVGCTNDCPEGDGWIFIQHNFGPIDDFVLLTNDNLIFIVDKKHHLWVHQWSSEKGFFEVLCNDDFIMSHQRYLTSVNSELLCLTDCEEQIHIFSDSLTGIQWTVMEKNTRLQRLIGVFSNENYVWALTTDRMICSSNGQTLEKPRQAQYLTHATFVPDNFSQDTILWSLDESCNIYVRANVESNTQWNQLDQSQFEWSRRLVHIVCNNAGVWAVDDQGYIHFRHGHITASQNGYSDELSLLSPAWVTIPGEATRHRYFSQVFCGPADWMVYATDNKQTVYARLGINEENLVGTSWQAIEDCSALELAISEYSLWLLTSCGEIQCRENISTINPIGTRSTTLSGRFLSLTVSMDDSQVWALDSKRNLLKLDRLTVLFEK